MKVTFQPGDFFCQTDRAIMQRVFDRHCEDFGYPPLSPVAEDLANAVVTLFKMGYTDEESLADAIAGQAYLRKPS